MTTQQNIFDDIRIAVIMAVFDSTYGDEKFAVKGGTAIDLIHKVDLGRSSADVDLSAESSIDEDTFKSEFDYRLKTRMTSIGFIPYGTKLNRRPRKNSKGENILGYVLSFGLVEQQYFDAKKTELEKIIKDPDKLTEDYIIEKSTKMMFPSSTGSQSDKGKFTIDISLNDYWGKPVYLDLNGSLIRTYSLLGIICEKIRAICQQMDAYGKRGNKTSRAKDFYDIFILMEHSKQLEPVPFSWGEEESIEQLKKCFEKKEVPLELLSEIQNTRDFHEASFEAVKATVSSEQRALIQDFDYYFDYVVGLANIVLSDAG